MCDTFVVLPSYTADGSVLFGKNSDREPNEAQALEFHPAHRYPAGRTVKCTYLEIPQARETLAVLLCRPFWMWGAEMGANERGVVIGNEAVFTRMPLSRRAGLTGMDLLRLALERADTAGQAVETMIQLLADHGQGGICGYEDRRMSYHNSFLCADPQEAWVLETAGPIWARRKVEGFASISNGLTIGEDFDACHPEAIRTAQRRGWLKKGEAFHFARCFSDWFYTTFSACRTRRARSQDLIGAGAAGKGRSGFGVRSAFLVLRDHGEGAYRPDTHLLGNRICAHAANKLARNATQTTGSLVAHLKRGHATYWATGTSAPCTGIFKPVWFGSEPLPRIGPVVKGTFQPDALWWRHESLHRAVLLDYTARLEAYRSERDALEREFLAKAAEVAGPDQQAALTRETFARAREATDRWEEMVRTLPVKRRARWHYRRYWDSRNRKAGVEISRA
jgi:dipeptidase